MIDMNSFKSGNLTLTIGERWRYDDYGKFMIVEILGQNMKYAFVRCLQTSNPPPSGWYMGEEASTTIGFGSLVWTRLDGQYSVKKQINEGIK